jgi:hypothetical protein
MLALEDQSRLIVSAKKIKDDLIRRAKAKKNYAKVLKEEGMASNRLSAPGEKGRGRERIGLVKDPYAAFKSGASDDEGSDDEDDEEEEQEAELMVAGRKRALSVSPPPPEQQAEAPKEETRRIKGKGKETPNDKSRPRPTTPNKGKARSQDSDAKAKVAFSKTRQPDDPAPDPKRSMRDMKKEAFSKRYPANGVDRSAGGVVGRKSRGQPNMGARMGVLLEQIKRGGK